MLTDRKLKTPDRAWGKAIPTTRRRKRDGVATVEFAILSPFFLLLVLGIMEIGAGFDTGMKLTSAVRDGGRLASMDYTQLTTAGQTVNQKIEADIRNYLTAAGIPGESATITITHADGPKLGQPFDLEDNDNYLALFRLTVEVPYEEISVFPLTYFKGKDITALIVFRKARVAANPG